MDFLRMPSEIQEHILALAGVNDYWKRRFSNDVLSCIDKGYRLVGVCTRSGKDTPCVNCYAYGPSLCEHEKWDHATFAQIKCYQRLSASLSYMTYDTFKFYYPADTVVSDEEDSDDEFERTIMFTEYINELYDTIHSLPKW